MQISSLRPFLVAKFAMRPKYGYLFFFVAKYVAKLYLQHLSKPKSDNSQTTTSVNKIGQTNQPMINMMQYSLKWNLTYQYSSKW